MKIIQQINWCKVLVTGTLLILVPFTTQAQRPSVPTPIEFLLGTEQVYWQFVLKKKFSEESKFNFFGLATFSANYEYETDSNRAIVISQVSYEIAKGFGVMAGSDFNSFSGLSAIIGPQHTFANKNFLAVTTVSFFLNDSADVKVFGLYEFKPKLTNTWNLYSRFQFIYNNSMKYGEHNKSYIYLRAGLKRKSFIFGLGANLDWSGPNKNFKENYGPFVRWEFN